MKTIRILGALVCCAPLLSSRADTIIGVGETLAVTNSEALGTVPLQLHDGARLVVPGGVAAPAGLNEYTRSNPGSVGTPDSSGYGDWTRITPDVYWATAAFTNIQTEYVYTGRWFVPEAGVYSFYEHIDDHAALAVDGSLVFRNTSYNTPTCVRDVPLAAGWHGLEIRLYNGAAGGGRYSADLASGILFSPSNDLISVANQTTAHPFADPGDGSVLRAARNGHLGQKVLVADTATLDLAEHDMALPFRLTGGLIPLTNTAASARLVVDGASELAFGAAGLDINYPPFNADVVFSNAPDAAALTFRDLATLYAFPTSCVWRVADGAMLALAGTNLLGAGDVALTNHSVMLLKPYAVSEDAAIRVQGTNLTVALKPCNLDALGAWTGTAATFTNDIALEGVNAAARFPVNADFYLQGRITGTGTVYKTGSARAQIKEPSDFTGGAVCDQGTLVFEQTTAGDSNNTVTVSAGATFALYPPGYGSAPTEAFIKTLRGTGITAKLYIPRSQAMTVDTAEGTLLVEGGGGGADTSLRVNTLAPGCSLRVIGSLAVTVGTIGEGAALTLDSAATPLAVEGGGTLGSLTLTAGAIPVSLSGAVTVGLLDGAGALIKRGPETLRVLFSSAAGGIRVEEGRAVLAPPDFSTVLGDLPALWLDANAPGVFTQYKTYVFTNGFQVIERWNDRRPGAPYYGYNSRGEDQWQVYPYVMTNNQNGLSVVSMGSYQQNLSADYGSRLEARRIPLSANLNPQAAVMLFGSQNGGGAAALGGTANLRRGGSTADDYRNPATPILAQSYPAWTNGVSVTATNTGFSGGYQILTLNTQGQTVNALGWRTDYQTAGGQNYGEVLLYTNALTALQRMTAEAYLAEKWNLPYAAASVPYATVAAGAALEIGPAFTVGRLEGEGTVTVPDGTAVELAGLFRGTLSLGGGTLTLSGLPPPPGPEAVPATGRSAWFDPNRTNRVVFGSAYTPTRPLAVAGLLDRESEALYLLGTCGSDLSSAIDRRPWLAATNGPWGTPLHWLDFQNIYPNDTRGNTLRMMRDRSRLGTEYTAHTPTNVQTGFIVVDSSRGGGVPIADTVYANGIIRRDDPASAASPIWGNGTTNILRNGPTWLDGVPVNGATSGYGGTTELLSFMAGGVFTAAYFGWFGNDSASTPNRERLGEIILFETALDDAARAGVEAYLMKKWLGKGRAGYSDLTAATIGGSGTVRAASPDRLPAFSPGFTGTVALSAASFAFTLSTNAAGAVAVSPAVSVPGTLAVAPAGTVHVHFAVKPSAGTYTLMTYGTAANSGFANWTLATSGSTPPGTVLLIPAENALLLRVTSAGTLILLQ
jgi:hypothetical protein